MIKLKDPITIYPGACLQNCKNIQGLNQKYHLKLQNGAVSEAIFIVFFTDSADRNRFSNKCRRLWGTFHSFYLSTVTTAIMVLNVFIIKNACIFGYKSREKERDKGKENKEEKQRGIKKQGGRVKKGRREYKKKTEERK
jgi:hypothetical protein